MRKKQLSGGNKMLIKILFIILIGLSAGGVTATGLFALISSIGLINRYADVTNTTESIMLYEEMIIFGAGIGNIWYIFELPIKLGVAGVILYGAVSGIFIGTFLICLAETVKALATIAIRTISLPANFFAFSITMFLLYFSMSSLLPAFKELI